MAGKVLRKDAVERVTLKIGDLVTFRTAKNDAFLVAEGILVEDLFVNPSLASLNDALFCVHLARQYSASRELDEYLAQLKADSSNAAPGKEGTKRDSNVTNFLNALTRGRDNETRLNNRYMQSRKGEPVKFGDVIQLFHVKSGKYLTIRPTELANAERENIKVSLDAKGTAFSGLVVMPRFKIDREGDPVSDNSDIFLTVSERRSEFLHCADRDPPPGHKPEINSSLEPTPWKMSIFQRTADGADPSVILAAEILYILDTETNCALMPTVAENEGDDDEEGEGGEGGREKETGGEQKDEEGEERAGEDDGEEGVGEEGDSIEPKPTRVVERFSHDFGNMVLQPVDPSGAIDTRSLWIFELRVKTQGGPVLWRTTQVRLKNLFSGHYLKCSSSLVRDEDGELEPHYIYSMTSDASEYGTMYTLTEINTTNKLLVAGKAYTLKSEVGCYLERGEEQGDKTFIVKGTKEKALALQLQVLKFSSGQEVVNPADIKQHEPLDVFVAMAARDYLDKYCQMTVIPKSQHVSTLWPTADRTDFGTLVSVIERTVVFSQGFPISAVDVKLGVDKSDLKLGKARQKILREQGVLDILRSIIEILVPLSVRADDIANMPKSQRPTLSSDELSLTKMGNMLLENCFRLLYYCILDNADNQMHVAEHIRSLLAHLGSQPLAGKCVTEMLSKNKELQETKITDAEIEIFVDKLRSSKMNSMYLELLRACCSCEGDGVDGNQCRVTEALFFNTNDIIIHIHADYTRINHMDWHPNNLYLPVEEVPGSPVRGEHLYLVGLPQLSLSWTTNSIDYSPLGLFGKLSVNVQELYKSGSNSTTRAVVKTNDTSAHRLALEAKKNHSQMQRDAIAKYFVAQIMLCAEMCMDRNYVAMHKVDTLFSFEVLVTILKLNVDDELKGAAARLLRCQHVDRDPQASSKIPVLTRTWSAISKTSDIKLPFVGDGRKYTFGLIQQILAEYIESMHGKNWTLLSKPMLELYSTLINFNFYGTLERMQDVIVPLTKAVDRRTILYEGDEGFTQELGGDGGSKRTGLPAETGDVAKKYATNESEEAKDDDLDDPDRQRDMTTEDAELQGIEEDKEPWQKRWHEIFESIPYLLSILTLVLAAVVVTIWQILGNPDAADGPQTPIGIWGLVVLALFIMDIASRAYCYHFVNGEILSFALSIFNQIDMLVIFIDIVFLCLPTSGADSNFTKTLRLVRLVRLLRIFRAANVLHTIASATVEDEEAPFVAPLRYTKAPGFELDAMVEIINTLLYANRVITDNYLSIFLRKFYEWESGKDSREPEDIFFEVVETGKMLSLGVPDFDAIFLDIAMFVHLPLVQGALDCIMFYHSTQRTLLLNAANVQLLISGKRERQFQQIQTMLMQLERNAETHELWGVLESDADLSVNKQTKDILKELADICRVKRFVFDSFQPGNGFMPDVEIQNLLNNLGCYNICQKVLGLLENVEEPDEDGVIDDVSLNTRELCLLCNDVMYWFCLDNKPNQEQAYGDLEFFIESLDGEINSHLVIQSMFSNNEKLMKLVPHVHLTEMVEKILSNGKSHHYLALADSISHYSDRNVSENQYEIMRVFTGPGRLQKLGAFIVPASSKHYAHKVALMDQSRDVKDSTMEQLEPLLAYHLTLLNIFAGCTSGRAAISSLEAKIQSVYSFTDAVECVLDPRSILPVQNASLKFLLFCVIDVNLPVPGLAESATVWRLVKRLSDELCEFGNYIKSVHKLGWDNPKSSLQKVEYYVLGMLCMSKFFEKSYDKKLFLHESTGTGKDKATLSQADADVIIKRLFLAVKTVFEINSPRLSDSIKEDMKKAMGALNQSHSSPILSLDEYFTGPDFVVAAPSSSEKAALENSEAHIHEMYKEFIKRLQESERIQKAADDENVEFITFLEGIPYVKDRTVKSDLRYELLIKKLVAHVRESMVIIDNETRIDNRTTITTIWLIRSFRAMIENKMGMTIYERDDDGGDKEDEASHEVKTALNTCGATALCLDLIVDGIDDELQEECIKLLVGLLFLEGGNRDVQGLIHDYLNRPQAFLFFRQCRNIIAELILWHEFESSTLLKEGQEPDPPTSILLIRMLQLMSEGHYHPNQDITREQPNSVESINLLDSFSLYLKCLSQHPCRTSTNAAIRVGATIVEVLQGPCKGNQVHLALNTEVLETCNRLMRAKKMGDCVVEEEVELKQVVIDLLQAIMEGQNMHGAIYERVLSVLHVDVIKFIALEDGDEEEAACEDYPQLRTECLVVLEMLVESRPSIKKEFNIPENLKGDHTDIGCVEIFWDKEMNRRYFHIPAVCALLSKASKDNLVENVNRLSQEIKLIDFLERARGLYREVKHQELLVSYGLSTIYSRQNQERTTWFSFVIACMINGLYLGYYRYDKDIIIDPTATIYYQDDVATAIAMLNYIQLVTSLFTLSSMFVVRLPVVYKTYIDADKQSETAALFWTCLDPVMLYYVWYLTFVILGIAVNDVFITFLLLDLIAKDSTARNVLNAIVVPRMNILYTLIVVEIINYIFSFHLVRFVFLALSLFAYPLFLYL